MLSILHSLDDAPEIVEEQGSMNPPGIWSRISAPVDDNLTDVEKEQLELLRSLGYLSGYTEVPVEMGITVYDTTMACSGYNLVLSGNHSEALLMDMNGDAVHTWLNSEVTMYDLWPDAQEQDITFDF
jgi:hypothetical protein